MDRYRQLNLLGSNRIRLSDRIKCTWSDNQVLDLLFVEMLDIPPGRTNLSGVSSYFSKQQGEDPQHVVKYCTLDTLLGGSYCLPPCTKLNLLTTHVA